METKGRTEIKVMSDEEFYEMREKLEKEKFLDSLMGASKTSRKLGFSVKSLRSKEKTEDTEETKEEDSKEKSSFFRRSDYTEGRFSEDEWNALLDRFDQMEPSPIDDVTDYEIEDFGKRTLASLGTISQEDDDAPTRYDSMYKKELAMYAEILKDVNTQTRGVASKLKSMTDKKSSYGVSKYYSDLIEQYNSLNNTKMNLVKNMADLKTKAEDFKLKRMKAEGDMGVEQGVDELVDQYYKTIMNGGRAEFMSKSLMSQSPYDSDREMYQNIISGDYENEYGSQPRASFNITQPIPEEYTEGPDESYNTDVDKYNYIKNEHRQPEICVQRWEDGSLRFIALDKDGLEVEDYALPGDDLLETMDIKPMSNFAYDMYGRKYSIIDVTTSGVDLDDLDDENYTYG